MHLLDSLIQSLSNSTTTDLIAPSDSRYASARLIYNRMHDCYPGLIVRTLNPDDLRLVMNFAFENNIVLAIRGGGHHIGGFSTCHDGIVIDFSPFKNVYIDMVNNIAIVEPGARLQDLDKILCDAGYVVPTGTISDTGVAGLTLGGGIGWLVGKYGLTCDHLCGADVLLANGEIVCAEAPEHAELLWALRGGGGNFGIVLNFRYRLNPLPKTICGMGLVAWENTMRVMNSLLQYIDHDCPASITIAPILVKNSLGHPTLRIDFCAADSTRKEVDALLAFSKFVTWSEVREWQFSAWQKDFDQLLLPPMRGYWKAAYLEKLTPDIIKSLCDSFEHAPGLRATIMIEHLHGVFKQYNQHDAAFPLRSNNFGIVLATRWENAVEDSYHINWVRQSFNAIDPQGTSATYVNYTSADDQRAVETLMKNSLAQIAKVKMRYDPNNYFKKNHNVLPKNISVPAHCASE